MAKSNCIYNFRNICEQKVSESYKVHWTNSQHAKVNHSFGGKEQKSFWSSLLDTHGWTEVKQICMFTNL